MTVVPSMMDRPLEPASGRAERPEVSVLVAVSERPAPLAELYAECAAVLERAGRSFEVVFAVPPYFRELARELAALPDYGMRVRVVEAGRGMGETALLRLALQASRGRIVVTMPAYRQVVPEVIAELVERVEDGADFATARRWPRRDPLFNRLQHRVLHAFIRRVGGDRVNDVGCGVRAMRREVLEDVPLYGDFARFLPLFALHHGYGVVEVPAAQHASDRQRRVYGSGVYLRRLIDVLGLYFLLRFTDKPLRFFGLVGSALSAAGALVLLVLLVERLGGEAIGGRPMLLLGVLLFTVGVQAVALGLIGEMIVHFYATGRRRYRLRPPAA